MKICPRCGEEVREIFFMFHKCAPSFENGKHKEDQKFGYVDWLKEWWVYCIFTPSFSPIWSKFDEENKFDILKALLYNTTTIIIPIWLVSLLIPESIMYFLGEIEVLGLVVLISPPFLVYFAWKFMLKEYDTYFAIFLSGQFLLILVYIFIFFGFLMVPM